MALVVGCSTEPADDPGSEAAQQDSALEAAATRCGHALCTTGTKLVKTCDPCVQKICTTDPYCCTTKWNAKCVREVASICGESCDGTPDMSTGMLDLSVGPPDLAHGGPDLAHGGHDGGGGGGGSVGPGGGTVDHLLFAVVGDTRPPSIDDTSGYPTPVIQKIYADIEGMSPRPQFVVGTGDYQYASTTSTSGAAQLKLYASAMHAFSGSVFAAMGNHECDGFTADNCAGKATNNLTAFMNTLVTPLGKSLPYYTIPINATGGTWTAKLIILACNQWDATQKSWLASELARSTTYTFVVRHEPASDPRGPCVNDVESLLGAHPYNLSIVGHTHHFQLSGKEVVVGNGGAPLSGGTYGYTTVEQTTSGFRVTNYDYASAAPVSSTTVPF
jgi:hypothetical protein